MTINAVAKSLAVAPSADGVRYADYPDGNKPLGGGGGGGGGSSVVTAVFTAHAWGQVGDMAATLGAADTITGPAPLSVRFDGIASTSTESTWHFGELLCYFDYDDAGAGTWGPSGQSKEYDIGAPVGGHVYETPGTYYPKVRVQAPDGSSVDVTLTVVVEDPDDHWAGTDTVCITTDTDTTWMVAGCQQIISATAWPTLASGKRYLFKRGKTYSSFGSKSLGELNDICIGAGGGGGAKPIMPTIRTVSGSNYEPTAFDAHAQVLLHDLDGDVLVANPVDGITVSKCDIRETSVGGTTAYFYDAASNKTASQWWYPRNGCFYECNVDSGGTDYSLDTGLSEWMYLGCVFDNTQQHSHRIHGGYKVYEAHCEYRGDNQAQTAKEGLTIRAGSTTAFNESAFVRDFATRYMVVRHPQVYTVSSNSFAIAVKPNKTTDSAGIEDVIIEYPWLTGGKKVIKAESGRRIMVRWQTGMDYFQSDLYTTQATPESWFGPYYSDDHQSGANGDERLPLPSWSIPEAPA